MRNEVQKVAWRAYWPVALLAITFLLVASIFGNYLNRRQQVANDRVERQRQAICAILANIPGHIPAEIARARVVFARPGHPGDCLPIVRRTPRPTPAPTVTVTPPPASTVVILRSAAPQATATVTASPRPRPTPTRTSSPTPSPSPTCLLILCR